jgi:hypothetical protein
MDTNPLNVEDNLNRRREGPPLGLPEGRRRRNEE